jgi:hypothetical protein
MLRCYGEAARLGKGGFHLVLPRKKGRIKESSVAAPHKAKLFYKRKSTRQPELVALRLRRRRIDRRPWGC